MKTIVLVLAALATLSSSHVTKVRLLTDEFIATINERQSTWIAGRNFPEGTTLEQLRRLAGALRGHFNESFVKFHNVVPENIPESFDARDQWPECESIKSIRNQGQCGSCWAFGAVEAMSDRLCIATGGKEKFEFSPEELVSCCSDCGDGCDGGWPYEAWKYWASKGIVSGGDYNSNEGCQPYPESAFIDGITPRCESKCTNSLYNTVFREDKHYGDSYYNVPGSVKQIQTEIMTHGPVEATYDVYEDFFDYKSGVYQYTYGDLAGGHAVKIIGWGTENGTPYWLIANSWGEDWGLSGFFKILRGENHVGIEGDISAGLPRV